MLSALRQTVNTELQVTKEVIEGKLDVELQSSQSVIGKIKQKARIGPNLGREGFGTPLSTLFPFL